MKCTDCSYYWQEEYENYASCHYPYDDDEAPCSYDDEPDDIDDDFGFDPYEGCFTYDC